MTKNGNNSIITSQKIARLLLGIRPAFIASALKKIFFLSPKIVKTRHGIFCIDIASFFGHELLTKGIYEPGTVGILLKFLKQGNIFIDIGANEGYFSVIASKLVGEKGRVIAVEPQKRLQTIITKNLELNHCSNVIVVPVAVSDQAKEAILYLSPNMNSGSSSLIRSTVYGLPKQKVKTLTLFEVLKQQRLEYCDFLKIDVEGWEYEVIMGSQNFFKSRGANIIYIEFHNKALAKRGLSVKIISKFLFDCGYKQFIFFNTPVFISQI